MRVYISGAITNTTDYIDRFEITEDVLRTQGYEVVNPAKILSYLPDTTTHAEYMYISYALLDICDSIYMIKGWKNSVGANLEYDYAIKNKKVVI